MPKTARPIEEVEEYKEKIIDATLKLIVEIGFKELTMRKIAKELGITATTLYNYFANKDQLYFKIRIQGFEILHESIASTIDEKSSIKEKMKAIIDQFLQFGLEFPDYYDIMFLNRDVPKYLDLLHTEIETTAFEEKQVALKPFYLAGTIIKEAYSKENEISDEEAKTIFIQMWCDLNGVISLHNSRLLNEVDENVKDRIEKIKENIYKRYIDIL